MTIKPTTWIQTQSPTPQHHPMLVLISLRTVSHSQWTLMMKRTLGDRLAFAFSTPAPITNILPPFVYSSHSLFQLWYILLEHNIIVCLTPANHLSGSLSISCSVGDSGHPHLNNIQNAFNIHLSFGPTRPTLCPAHWQPYSYLRCSHFGHQWLPGWSFNLRLVCRGGAEGAITDHLHNHGIPACLKWSETKKSAH